MRLSSCKADVSTKILSFRRNRAYRIKNPSFVVIERAEIVTSPFGHAHNPPGRCWGDWAVPADEWVNAWCRFWCQFVLGFCALGCSVLLQSKIL